MTVPSTIPRSTGDGQKEPQYTALPARVRRDIASFVPPDNLITERMARFADVAPRPPDRDGDVEVLDGVRFTHRFASTPGDEESVHWHYVEAGRGDPVVFLHGMPDSWFLWHHQMAALSDTHRCIAVDLKGYGQSEKGRGDYRNAGAAEQLIGLLDALGLNTFVLVTHDRGTVQGDHLVARHPERVSHYVRGEQHLYHFHPDLAPHDELIAEAPWTGLMDDPTRFVVRTYAFVANLPVSDGDMRRTIQEFSYPDVTRAVARYGMTSSFRKEWLERRRGLMARWRCPVTLVQGHDSRSQPRELYTDAAAHLPNAPEVVVRFVPGGHFWPLESPRETSTTLREVLGPRPAGGSRGRTVVTGFGTVGGVPDLPDGFARRFTSDRYDLDGVALHAVTGGTGPALLLVGGWPQFWWQWRTVMPALAEHRSVVAVDPRGVGRSDAPKEGYDTGTAAADLARLMTALGHERFDVVGHDIGMILAYALAADAPQRVRRLVLAEAALPGVSDEPSAIPADDRLLRLTWHFMFNRLATVNEQLVEGREDVYFRDQFAAKGATPTAMPAEVVDVYLDALRRPGALHASFQYYRAFGTTIAQNHRRAATPLPMPVLAVGGETSRGAAVAADVERVADDVTGLVLPDCGHYVAEEAPAAFTAAVLSFLLR